MKDEIDNITPDLFEQLEALPDEDMALAGQPPPAPPKHVARMEQSGIRESIASAAFHRGGLAELISH